MINDLKNLTLDEKITLLTGKDAWNIHDIPKLDKFNMADGPCGLRKVEFWADGTNLHHRSIAYASPSVLANSWDKELVKSAASAMADDCIGESVDMLLAPGINIKRDPRCGRNFEYFSEDPLLAGTLAKEYIDGLQEKGVGSSLKHYCANNSEFNRQSCSSEMDKRTLMEIYTRNFGYACKAKPTTVMCAYNKVNGVWCSENKEINDILYNRLGFDGAIISDWEAVHNKVNTVKAGLALQMPYRNGMFEEVKSAYEKGELTEAEIDACAGKTVDLINKIQEMKSLRKVTTTTLERYDICEKGALEGAVLLKNNGVLPMKKGSHVGVAGTWRPDLYCGGGSAHVWCLNECKPIDLALKEVDPTSTVKSAMNKIVSYNGETSMIYPWGHPDETANYVGENPDYMVLSVATGRHVETEGKDRKDIKVEEPLEAYIRYVGDHYKGKVIVLLYAGSAVDVSSWIDRVDALILVGFAGERENVAMAKLLFGDASPCGKLAETFPVKLEDISCLNRYNDYMTEDYYTDGIYVGYRHYDKNNIKPMYEFGFGLSYANFTYSDLSVKDNGKSITVSYKIKNTSDIDAKEISQIYMSAPAKVIDRPVKDLIGYSKDLIKAGEEVTVTLDICKCRMTYFDVKTDDFAFENGEYNIMIGASSRDIKLEQKINL
ncbi:MAG: glycoside hydrolase family 3 C-terminal domain-containing protein [Clostridia bacterium]|nr:glycoside hydrolase family 3 C-terminal domain-containing protein [Clostridia bacterium]